MKKFSLVTAVFFILSLVLVSGAFAQDRGMGNRDFYRSDQYRQYQNDRFDSSPRTQPYSAGERGGFNTGQDTRVLDRPVTAQELTSPPIQGVVVDRGTIMVSRGMQGTTPGVGAYYGDQAGAAEAVSYASVVPPPLPCDVASEDVNRRNTRPLQRYVEMRQGVPTPGECP